MINKSNNYKINVLNLYGILLMLFLLGIYISPDGIKIYSILFVSLFLAVTMYRRGTINLTNSVKLWIMYIFVGIISAFLTGIGDIYDVIEFVVSILIGIMINAFAITKKNREAMVNAIGVVCLVVLVGCILQILFPDILLAFNQKTLAVSKYNTFLGFFSYNALVGFSYQTGVTGYYLAVLEGLILCDVLFSKRNKNIFIIELLLMSLVFYFILLTRKRSQLFIVLMITMLFLAMKYRKHLFKILGIGVVVLIAAYYLIEHTNVGLSLIERTFGKGVDATTGRTGIYMQLLENFWKHPIFGNGFGSTIKLIRGYTNGHNIYLQTLSETGIVGFVLLAFILLYNLIIALKACKLSMKKQTDNFDSFFCLYLQLIFLLSGLIGNPLYDVYPLIIYLTSCRIIFDMKKTNI